MSKEYRVAVVGATGAVGRAMRSILAERDFPVKDLVALATAKSAGLKLDYRGQEITCQELTPDSFKDIDLALFSAGGGTSLKFAPMARDAGCVVVDNSSAWRMDADVPLVVPEVNPDDVDWHKGIIANPNCSTIQMVVAMKPLHDEAKIKRVVVSTYQAVSGTGNKAIVELLEQTPKVMAGEPVQPNVYPHQIAFNCLPHIDVFLEDGYTKEEQKMVDETKKIMGDDSIARDRHLRARAGAEQPLRVGQPAVRKAPQRRAGPRAAGGRTWHQVGRRSRPPRSTPCPSTLPARTTPTWAASGSTTPPRTP